MSLQTYRQKRNFSATPEPQSAKTGQGRGARRFVIQKHAASHLHYDLRLQLGRAFASWAVPKGMPLKHGEKHLAVKVEDHPLSYGDFEGTIPKGEYGGGTVQVWDTGTFEPISRHPVKDLRSGKLHFILYGTKLAGEWYLVRLRDESQWLLIRGGADHRPLPRREADLSVLSGRTMKEIASNGEKSDPPVIEPMKARLVKEAPHGRWSYEVKFDGFRVIAIRQSGAVRLFSRTQHELTDRFPEIARAVAALKIADAIIDGEVVALDPKGRSSFQLLQNDTGSPERPPIFYYAFDLLQYQSQSLLDRPLEKRREKLRALLPRGKSLIRYSASLGEDAGEILQRAAALGFEGIIGKRLGSVYEPGKRSGAWIKLKLAHEQEFVIGGYTDPAGSRKHLGAILIGYYHNGILRYAGKVGTGFDTKRLHNLHHRLLPLRQTGRPFRDPPPVRRCHWVRPELVAQIRFAEWTRDGRLRQPVFLGLRPDKPASEVIREVPE